MAKHAIIATITNKQGAVLAVGRNNYNRSHPIQAHFAEKAGQPERIYLHAEIAALIKLRKDDRPFKIAVERYTKDGLPALARPCAVCMAAIKHWKIGCIEYTL